jgi:hypothetical protein
MNFRCPVCMYPALPYPPSDYHICPCCGTEFGNDDEMRTHADLRREWINNGAHWFFNNPPRNWNQWGQLEAAGYASEIPWLRGLTIKQTAESVYNIDPKSLIQSAPLVYTHKEHTRFYTVLQTA